MDEKHFCGILGMHGGGVRNSVYFYLTAPKSEGIDHLISFLVVDGIS